MNGQFMANGSFVDNKYGLNRDRVKGYLENNVSPDISLDGMIEMAKRYPIDVIGEFYGITKDNKNNISQYMDKGIERDDHIAVVEDHFRSIGMPIPGGFKNYKVSWMRENDSGEIKTDILKVAESTGKTIEEIAEEKRQQELLNTKPTNDGNDGNNSGDEGGESKESTDNRPKKPSVTKKNSRKPIKRSRKTKNSFTNRSKPQEQSAPIQPEGFAQSATVNS